ncbi:hypothetical protein KFE25_007092 [Diacronema lutheri]|uniref:Uncharacterized protein n=1 Tax=Diacronema lutheri TaxID=2081491 RepID=A0A8J5XYX0_DIALT|nr:hypothetical protein KFE25_007092 [Diacronema lutheri]
MEGVRFDLVDDTFEVEVPASVFPGMVFDVLVGENVISVPCPDEVAPGDIIHLDVPPAAAARAVDAPAHLPAPSAKPLPAAHAVPVNLSAVPAFAPPFAPSPRSSPRPSRLDARRRRVFGCLSSRQRLLLLVGIAVVMTIALVTGIAEADDGHEHTHGACACPHGGCDQRSCDDASCSGGACDQRKAASASCAGGGCVQRSVTSKASCFGGDCDQGGAHVAWCQGGACDQTCALSARCDGGGCTQGGNKHASCHGGGCGRADLRPGCS